MDLNFNINLAAHYKNNSQRARVLTEDWACRNLFCPICGKPILTQYENNKPVADFFCEDCKSDFELKSKESKRGYLGRKIMDGTYNTMISRIESMKNPNFFFLTYNHNSVNNLLLIPKYFIVPDIIEKRKALSNNARRAGWIGCNINIEKIPESGKIFIIKDNCEIDKQQVITKYKRIEFLKTHNLESRSWIMDVLNCIGKIPTENFSLNQVYAFADELQRKHPENKFVKDKIRQQLQYLRDKGFLEFTTRVNYKKIK